MAEIFVVASGKGGVGKSTFVAGISKELSQAGKKVLAVDCDTGLRSLDLLLGCGEQVVFDWGDAVLGRCEPSDAVTKGETDFLAAPRQFNDSFTGENLKKLIEGFAGDYDYIFLDAPAGIDSGFRLASSCAERGIIISTPDSVCVRSCERAASELEKAGVTDIRLVINMFEVKPVKNRHLLNIDECVDETGVMLLGIIPFDRQLAFSSVTGDDPGEFSPSSQAFYRISVRMSGGTAELVCE